MVTGSSLGYEYVSRFWMDTSIIERFSSWPDINFLFDIRTSFVVKRTDGGGDDDIVDSERDEFAVMQEKVSENWLYNHWKKRLRDDYWMSEDEFRELVRKASSFARQKQEELANSLPLVPVVVEIDVCTVQKPGEPIGDVHGRALMAKHMYPLSICAHSNQLSNEPDGLGLFPFDGKVAAFLRHSVQVDRVENVQDTLESWMAGVENIDEAGLAGVCRLCEQKATIGAQIARLPGCFHRFHYHCIVEWVLKYEMSCPTCLRPVPRFPLP